MSDLQSRIRAVWEQCEGFGHGGRALSGMPCAIQWLPLDLIAAMTVDQRDAIIDANDLRPHLALRERRDYMLSRLEELVP